MDNVRKFYKCNHCGNVISMIEDKGTKVMCCGQPMSELTPNTVDAATEKHVPTGTREGNKLTVVVGSTLHPMLPEHHISWIAVAQGNKTQRAVLDPAGTPEVTFYVEEGDVTVYEYCNLHGLWSASL